MRLMNRRTGNPVAKPRARRRKAAPRWLKPVRKTVIVLGIAAVAVGGPYWSWRSGLIAAGMTAVRDFALDRTAEVGLKVRTVLLEGRHNTPRGAVQRAVGLARGEPILGVDIVAIRKRLVALPWIREATVVRRLPDTVDIRVAERIPFALWQRKNRLVLVDDAGVVIASHGLGAFRSLPILVGRDAPRHAPTLFAMLHSEPRLAAKVVSAARIGKRRWNIELKNGIKVQLPETDPHVAWRRLAWLDARHKLLARDVRMIDMRLPDRMIVLPGPLGAQTLDKTGRKT